MKERGPIWKFFNFRLDLNNFLVIIRVETVPFSKLAGACLLLHELSAAEGGGPILHPYSIHLWIAYGAFDFLSTLTKVEHLEHERVGYLTVLYSLMNSMDRIRRISISLGAIPRWSSFKQR